MKGNKLFPLILMVLVGMLLWWLIGIIMAVFSCWVFYGEFSLIRATIWRVILSAAAAVFGK